MLLSAKSTYGEGLLSIGDFESKVIMKFIQEPSFW